MCLVRAGLFFDSESAPPIHGRAAQNQFCARYVQRHRPEWTPYAIEHCHSDDFDIAGREASEVVVAGKARLPAPISWTPSRVQSLWDDTRRANSAIDTDSALASG